MTTPKYHATDTTSEALAGPAFVVGGGPVGLEAANQLAASGETVTLVDRVLPTDPPPGHDVRRVDDLTGDALRDAGLHDAATVLVLEPDDAASLFVAQLARTRFDADRVLVRVNDPARASAFEALGVETLDTTAAVVHAILEQW